MNTTRSGLFPADDGLSLLFLSPPPLNHLCSLVCTVVLVSVVSLPIKFRTDKNMIIISKQISLPSACGALLSSSLVGV